MILFSEYSFKILLYIFFPFCSFLLSVLIVWWLLKILPKIGLIDIPRGRHIHKLITPKGGGLGIFLSFFVTWGCVLFVPFKSQEGAMDGSIYTHLLIPSFLLVALGFFDDKYNIKPLFKLIGQVIVASICWYYNLRFDSLLGINLSDAVSYLFTLLWIVSFINAFNLIDGLDGLAAGLAVVSSLFMAAVFLLKNEFLNGLVTLVFCGACLGFLKYNFHPARIFLGDTGSMFIGFIISIIGLISSFKSATFSAVLIPILASGVPMFDTFLAVWRRSIKKLYSDKRDDSIDRPINAPIISNTGKVMEGDAEHLHHRILERSGSQSKTAWTLYIIAIVCGMISLCLLLLSDSSKGLVFLIMMIVTITAVRQLATVEMWNSTKALINGIHRPKRGVAVILAHPFYDLIVLVLTFGFANYVFNDGSLLDLFNKRNGSQLLLSILPVVIVLNIFGTYKRYWMRANSIDYLHLFKLLLAGFVVSAFISWYSWDGDITKVFYATFLFQFFMAFFMIMGERLMLRYVNSTLLQKTYIRNSFHQNITNILLYGGGLNCYYFLNMKSKKVEDDPIRVVGIIDDYPGFRGKYLYGYRVLGDIRELSEVVKENSVERIVITTENIKKENYEIVYRFCSQNRIQLDEIALVERVKVSF